MFCIGPHVNVRSAARGTRHATGGIGTFRLLCFSIDLFSSARNWEISRTTQEKSILYDTSEDDHKDQQNVGNAWSSIAKMMDKDDVTGKIYFNWTITHDSE